MDTIDPLDELRKDSRDNQPVPRAFAAGLGQSHLRRPEDFVPGLALASIYFLYGSAPSGKPAVSVMDPPWSGWGKVLVLDQTPTSRRIFSAGNLKSWVLKDNCYEMLSLQEGLIRLTIDWKESLVHGYVERLRSTYAAHKRRGWADSDYATTERVLELLGSKAPSEEEWEKLAPSARKSDKIVASETNAAKAAPKTTKGNFKPIKLASRKGQVLKFFLDGGTSAEKAMAAIGVQRNNLLSQLFLLRKDHGIEYKVSGDDVSIIMPEGVTDPFAES